MKRFDGVVSIAWACDDPALRDGVLLGDEIRRRALSMLCAMSCYKSLTLAQKNRRYDYCKRVVMAQMGVHW